MKRNTLLFLSLSLATASCMAAEDGWKLQPLGYNHPGLVVDLGVGLWAWPMPMDYDGDGDMDLLVACPDKPTNGVYFFENPSQDPKVKMPVFKPGMRLGKTTHNFQVSFVDGKPHILKPGYEFPRNEETGVFDFNHPKKIYPRSNVHPVGVRGNMWRYVDFDGDGDQDLVVGVGDWTDYSWDHAYDNHGHWQNGPLHGYVYLVDNEGSDAAPKYSEHPRKLQAGGGDIDVFGSPSPNFADFDRDGRPDLLVGAENGRIYYIHHNDCIAYSGDQLKARPAQPETVPRFPGFVSEDFVFITARFPQCHASTICETTRGLVVAWFGGTKEKAEDVGIWVSYNDGNRWSSPKEWANGVQHENLVYPCWNPVLFQPPGDAPTLLFFKVGPSPSKWWGEMMLSYDRGRTFRQRRRLPEGIDGPVRCKPVLVDGGQTLLCGSSTEYDGWRVHFEKVKLLDGQPHGTWRRIGPINKPDEFNAIQPTFLQHADGRLQVLCRTKEGVIATSFSKDNGSTWSKLEATNLPNPNSGIEAITLSDGRHLLVYNHMGSGITGWGDRGMLNLAISSDGQQWHQVAVLEQEDGAEFSYPAIIQTADGLVHMTYTWKRQRIKHLVVDPDQIHTGEALYLKGWNTPPQNPR